jgi:hypothetical protein
LPCLCVYETYSICFAVTTIIQIAYVFLASKYWLALGIFISCFPAAAAAQEQPFPDIPFATFSDFIQAEFSSDISLSTVLMILLSMTQNTALLGLCYE